MKSFLTQVAEEVLGLYPNDLHNVCILLPSKRGETFLKEAFATLINKPFLAPKMLTIEEFVQQASGYQKQSQLQLLVQLFNVYQQKAKKAETFDSFLKWGATLLQDYNEIDRHLIDAKQLYGNLLDTKKIESWGVSADSPTELMQNFLAFWQDLFPVYKEYTKQLAAQNLSYQGMAYRKIAEQPSLMRAWLGNNYSGVVLAGFNALNKAEEAIFHFLAKEYNAHLFWDADAYYVNDVMQEAGQFIRQHKKNGFGVASDFSWLGNHFLSQQKKIHIASAPSMQGMAQLAAHYLQTIPNATAEETALVLADEAMLLPMLDSLPDSFSAVNITMGFPLNFTHIARDLHVLIKLHEQAERLNTARHGYKFHYRALLSVSESPTFKPLLGAMASRKIQAIITNENLVFLSVGRAKEVWQSAGVPAYWLNLLEAPPSATIFANLLNDAVKRIATNATHTVDEQAAYTLHRLLNQFAESLEQLPENINLTTFSRLYGNMLRDFQIDFFGEPLAGLQLMGMLETRALDFKRIIITSVNEGILPSGKSHNSFIPYDLKVAFNMPTHHDKDAIYAYHFYRLLQRAEEVWLIYDSSMSGLGSKEKSRFIAQIETEMTKLPNIQIAPVWHFSPDISGQSLLHVPTYTKDDAVLNRLLGMANYGFSASAIIGYINNPSLFYVERMLRVQEPDEVNETIGHDTLGNVVHEALQALYQPFVQLVLDADDLKQLLKSADDVTLQFLKKLYKGNLDEGRNLLIKKVAQHMVREVIKADIERAKLNEERRIIILEEDLAYTTQLPNSGRTVKFIGKADRIEATADEIFIVDYKTGFLGNSELTVKGVADVFIPEKKNKAFQVMFYAWLYSRCKGLQNKKIAVGLFFTRTPSAGFLRLKLDKSEEITTAILDEFEGHLFNLIEEIFDTEMPFQPHGLSLAGDDES